VISAASAVKCAHKQAEKGPVSCRELFSDVVSSGEFREEAEEDRVCDFHGGILQWR